MISYVRFRLRLSFGIKEVMFLFTICNFHKFLFAYGLGREKCRQATIIMGRTCICKKSALSRRSRKFLLAQRHRHRRHKVRSGLCTQRRKSSSLRLMLAGVVTAHGDRWRKSCVRKGRQQTMSTTLPMHWDMIVEVREWRCKSSISGR